MNQIITTNADHHIPWNKGKLIGQKSPLKLKEIWAIRIRLQLANRTRELALFNLAIDCQTALKSFQNFPLKSVE